MSIFFFFTICHDFFIIFWTFYVAFCAYRPSPIRKSRCRPSRQPRPRLWTMNRTWMGFKLNCKNCCSIDHVKIIDQSVKRDSKEQREYYYWMETKEIVLVVECYKKALLIRWAIAKENEKLDAQSDEWGSQTFSFSWVTHDLDLMSVELDREEIRSQ